MATNKTHKKPAFPKEAVEAEKVAKQMYSSLTEKGAPKASPEGYIMGACTVVKLLLDQAVAQGSDKEELKLYALNFINGL